MDIKVNALSQVTQTETAQKVQQSDGSFKFTLVSHIEDAALKEHIAALMGEITEQGKKIAKKKDVAVFEVWRNDDAGKFQFNFCEANLKEIRDKIEKIKSNS